MTVVTHLVYVVFVLWLMLASLIVLLLWCLNRSPEILASGWMPLDEMTSHVRALLVVLNYPERIGRLPQGWSLLKSWIFKHWHMYFQ